MAYARVLALAISFKTAIVSGPVSVQRHEPRFCCDEVFREAGRAFTKSLAGEPIAANPSLSSSC